MRRLYYVLIFLVILMNIPFVLTAQDDYKPSQLPTLIGDFNLSYNLLDEYGKLIEGSVGGAATIRILQDSEPDGKIYTMTLYLDRSYVLSKDNISLPYDFKWSFRGLSNGEHELFFVLKNSEGKLGALNCNVLVGH